MVVESVPHTDGNPALESAKAAYLAAPSKKKEKLNKPNTGTELERAISGVEISESGKELSALEHLLQSIADSSRRKTAQKGMDKVVQYLAGENSGTPMRRFLDFLKTLAYEADNSDLQEAFVEAGDASFGNDQISTWLAGLGLKK